MKNKTIETSGPEFCAGAAMADEFRWAMQVLNGKWKNEILWHLAQATLRFGELRRLIPGVTQHMLTMQLRDLEANGLVKRTIFAEVPPRVEYEVTDAARALTPVFEALFVWSTEYGNLNKRPVDASADRD
ncbi:MAG: transcriptional regulator [Bradyrhizobium sp. 35-63-5]|nr:MAG: transcriptional regulator [Bradyrhizobium sp. 35-63-5]